MTPVPPLVPLTRRRFLATGSSALAVTCLGSLGACASLAMREITPMNGRLELPLTRYELAARDGALRFQVAGHEDPVDVLVVGDGQFVALSPICTHLGCTVEVQGTYLVCPCHGSTYERSGRVIRGPAERSLRRYDVTMGPANTLVVDLDRPPRNV